MKQTTNRVVKGIIGTAHGPAAHRVIEWSRTEGANSSQTFWYGYWLCTGATALNATGNKQTSQQAPRLNLWCGPRLTWLTPYYLPWLIKFTESQRWKKKWQSTVCHLFSDVPKITKRLQRRTADMPECCRCAADGWWASLLLLLLLLLLWCCTTFIIHSKTRVFSGGSIACTCCVWQSDTFTDIIIS